MKARWKVGDDAGRLRDGKKAYVEGNTEFGRYRQGTLVEVDDKQVIQEELDDPRARVVAVKRVDQRSMHECYALSKGRNGGSQMKADRNNSQRKPTGMICCQVAELKRVALGFADPRERRCEVDF